MVAYAKTKGAMLLGPGSIGINTPESAPGMAGRSVEFAKRHFVAGHVAAFPSGGSPAPPLCHSPGGIRVSTVLHVGTEPVTGMSFADSALFQEDPIRMSWPSSVRWAVPTRRKQRNS